MKNVINKTKTHLIFPRELLETIDRLVGRRKRSEFVTEIVERELKRKRLETVLEKAAGAWKDEDHPEIKSKGAYRWVKGLRKESEKRFKKLSK